MEEGGQVHAGSPKTVRAVNSGAQGQGHLSLLKHHLRQVWTVTPVLGDSAMSFLCSPFGSVKRKPLVLAAGGWGQRVLQAQVS